MIERVKPEDTSWGKLLFVGLLMRFWTVATVAGVIVLLGLWFGAFPAVPRWLKVGALASIAVVPIGWAAGVKAGNADHQYHYLLDVELPGNAGEGGALYELSEADFRELEVLEDELEDWAPFLHVGKGVHIDELVVEEGTWMGALSKRELLTARAKMAELRGDLEDDAKKGFVLEANAFIIIRGATQAAIRRIVETFERGTLPDDGDGLSKRIDDALERFDLDESVDAVRGDPLEELDFDLDDVIEGDPDDLDDELVQELGLPSPDGGEADDD